MGEDLEIPKPGGGVVLVAGDELLPGAEAGTPGFETASQLEWYRRGDDSLLGTGEQQRKQRRWALVRMAQLAARYGENGRYRGPLPRVKNAQVDHAKVAANVIRWVEEALEPDTGQVEGSAFENVFDWFEAGKLGPGVTKASALEDHGRPVSFVCIDHARLAAALFRRLGYHAQEVNVVVGLRPPIRRGNRVEWGNLFLSYQSAALRVFYNGRWNYFDAFLHTTDLERTIRATILAPQTLRPKLTGVTKIEQVPTIEYKVVVAGGPVTSFTLKGTLRTGMRLQGPWVEIETGEYDTKTKVLTRKTGKK